MAEVGFSIVYYVLLSIYQTLGKNDIWPDEQKKRSILLVVRVRRDS